MSKNARESLYIKGSETPYKIDHATNTYNHTTIGKCIVLMQKRKRRKRKKLNKYYENMIIKKDYQYK